MHKNLVLDMGNVLVTYDPVWVIQEYTDREDWIKEIKDVMFYSGEWIRLDAGLMSEENALKAWMKRCSSPQVAELCKSCFENWDKFNMKKIPGVAEILKEEKEQGRKLYLFPMRPCGWFRFGRKCFPDRNILTVSFTQRPFNA